MADFVGTVNLVKATVVSTEADAAHIRVADEVLVVPGEWDGLQAGHEVLLSIRPESLRVVPPGDGLTHDGAAFSGEVVRHTFLGRLMRYAVKAGDLEWLVDQPDPGAGPPLEGPVLVQVQPSRVHIIPEVG
jgi:ABC-type Fe3+/spermidine/putrescine transport system ATPase subunit